MFYSHVDEDTLLSDKDFFKYQGVLYAAKKVESSGFLPVSPLSDDEDMDLNKFPVSKYKVHGEDEVCLDIYALPLGAKVSDSAIGEKGEVIIKDSRWSILWDSGRVTLLSSSMKEISVL